MLAFTLYPIDFCANFMRNSSSTVGKGMAQTFTQHNRFRASAADMLRPKLYTAWQSGNVCPHCTWRSTKNDPIQSVKLYRGEQHSSAWAQNCAEIGRYGCFAPGRLSRTRCALCCGAALPIKLCAPVFPLFPRNTLVPRDEAVYGFLASTEPMRCGVNITRARHKNH